MIIDFIQEIVRSHYGMETSEVKKLTVGAGSDTYFVNTDHGKFILKNANINEMNHPQNEPPLCGFLIQKGLSVSEFIRCKNGDYTFTHDSRLYHMQKFIDGNSYEWHTAPAWLLSESARMLGKIHAALTDYPPLPVGIGENFFKYMTPENALKSYESSYRHATQIGDPCAEDIAFRIDLIKRFSIPAIQLDRLTRKNTHGDFFISQLICGEDKINAVIDWTSAGIHPVVWEIIRSYIYAAHECRNGEIDAEQLIGYVNEYLKFSPLTDYDIAMMPYVFYYQISVCDYYNQYYQSTADNREIYLRQAILSTKLMRWFDKNADELSDTLVTSIKNVT